MSTYSDYLETPATGFASPAEDFVDGTIDLNAELIQHPAATFFLRARGDGLTVAGVEPGDVLVVDRSLSPRPGKLIVAIVDGRLVVRRFGEDGSRDFEIWGCICWILRET